MATRTFNLTTQPWLKVMDAETGTVQTVSLQELFAQAGKYRQLAGDMRVQDLAILRLLLAILHTVYSRFNARDEPYDWLELTAAQRVKAVDANGYEDTGEANLLETWQTLYDSGHFTQSVLDYLTREQDRFDFFGERPFYQATQVQYDNAVPAKKRVETGVGTVDIKQINRTISESNHTPAIFTPKTGDAKNQLSLDELIRWVITYQNFTGVTDKTKIETADKFSTPRGWLYGLNPVFVKGDSLFQTLMLNLVLFEAQPNETSTYQVQRPVWEYDKLGEYLATRKKLTPPADVAGLYTALTRLLYLDWDADDVPRIFSAGIPMFEADNLFVEPMTTWRQDTKAKPPVFKPATRRLQNMSVAMWRNFGQYVNVHDTGETYQPGVVTWLDRLKDAELIPEDMPLTLASIALISDGNATSQAPAAQLSDEMTIRADVLFDTDKQYYWPDRIEDTIDLTQQIGRLYWQFIRRVSVLRGAADNETANRESGKFYEQLNAPFASWLAQLTNDDDRDEKINAWKKSLRQIVFRQAEAFTQNFSARDIRGITDADTGRTDNLFTLRNQFIARVNKVLA